MNTCSHAGGMANLFIPLPTMVEGSVRRSVPTWRQGDFPILK